ncbi:hypothetical protein MRX96_019042 [Rhipicephalus microplus]
MRKARCSTSRVYKRNHMSVEYLGDCDDVSVFLFLPLKLVWIPAVVQVLPLFAGRARRAVDVLLTMTGVRLSYMCLLPQHDHASLAVRASPPETAGSGRS